MLSKIAKFEKISWEQFLKDFTNYYPEKDEEELKEIYDNIQLPRRATTGSAGYDFFLPVVPVIIKRNETMVIPTGIKCKIEEGWVLNIYPRSSFGFKQGLSLANTVGIIDADYYNNKNNEGHIFVKLCNSNQAFVGSAVNIEKKVAFCQGVFLPFGITEDDSSDACRTGGIGSTN